MGAMLGVVLSGNLIQLVFFWELTTLFSFLLIGYWHHSAPARDGARMSLTVTATGGLALFGGILLLGHIAGSYDLDVVLVSGDAVRDHPAYLPALVLILLGALTKSAQFPFHFWLPHAMAAPTPVSAYLHSATLVKAGVFLLARLWPVLAGTEQLHIAITERFEIGWWLYLVPLTVVLMIWRKVPALPALFVGAVLGALFAVLFQADLVRDLADNESGYLEQAYQVALTAMGPGIAVTTGNEVVDELLSAGGMAGMMNTIWLIVCAMTFGGVMFATGMLQRITAEILRFVTNTASLVGSTVLTCLFFNVTAADQYLAILVPGRMYADIYRKRGLKPENLSRTLEDSATVTSVLVPWNTCGATQATVLGVATLTYAPYCFFNIISPIMTILFGYLKLGINFYSKEEMKEISSIEKKHGKFRTYNKLPYFGAYDFFA
jgi:Na+/H+ antiporter NhaC